MSGSLFSRREPIIIITEDVLNILRRQLANSIARARSGVALPCTGIPPHSAKQANEARDANRVVHVRGRDGIDCWEEQHRADENDPCHSDGVDGLAPRAHRVRAGVEDDAILIPAMRDNHGNVGDVECWCGDVKDGGDGQCAADAD